MIRQAVSRVVRAAEKRWPLLAGGGLSAIWLPALGRGFIADDFHEVPLTWRQLVANPLINDGRPVETLTFALLPSDAFVQHACNLVLYVACLWAMWRLCRRMRLAPWPTLLALSSLFHPAFLWSVTWIAQRSDLLVILALLLALSTARTPLRLLWIVLGSGAKTPFIVQNLVFGLHFARRRALAASVISLLSVPVFLFAGYTTYYAAAVREGHIPTVTEVGAGLAAPIGLAKVLEGVFFIFAPVPMFTVAPWGPIVAVIPYAACWYLVARTVPRPQALWTDAWIPAIAVALCVPFIFASEVRVTGIAAVPAFLTIAAAMQPRPSARLAIVGILALNLSGIFLNYGAFDSVEYDIRAAPAGADRAQPVYAYETWRREMRHHILAKLGVSVTPGPGE